MTLNIDRRNSKLLFRMRRKVRHLAKKVYQFIRRSKKAQPVFIVGSGRSGTDIVAHSLSLLWDVDLVNEDNPKAFENWRLKDLNTITKVIHESRASFVVFKPIVETLRASSLLRQFDDSQVIFVVRNPYDAINSMVRFFGEAHIKTVRSWVDTNFFEQPGTPVELREFIGSKVSSYMTVEDASGLYWLLYNNAYQFLALDELEEVLPVNYENLVQQPESETRRLTEFLGLKWSRAMVKNIYNKSVGKDEKPILDAEIEERCLQTWQYLQNRLE